MPTYPALAPFALVTLVLALNLFFLWGWSGAVRGKTKTAMNSEDAKAFQGELVESDPPAVARVLRAHANAQANILPTLALGLVYVLLGGGAQMAWILLGAFAAGRWLHSITYLVGKQPWRTISFSIAGIASIVLLGYDALLVSRVL
jgi:microsomal prostaglandin-E synthase 1